MGDSPLRIVAAQTPQRVVRDPRRRVPNLELRSVRTDGSSASFRSRTEAGWYPSRSQDAGPRVLVLDDCATLDIGSVAVNAVVEQGSRRSGCDPPDQRRKDRSGSLPKAPSTLGRNCSLSPRHEHSHTLVVPVASSPSPSGNPDRTNKETHLHSSATASTRIRPHSRTSSRPPRAARP